MPTDRLKENIQTILDQDPAARSVLEVILCYPGFHAVSIHNCAHWLWQQGAFTLARWLSHVGRVLTGIEIHPGAKLGRRLFIDHGMGVVIGETTIVGDDCVIYQGVTLGAGAEARMGAVTRGKKRHPTLGNGVIVGSNAEIQGDIVIGDNVRVASGSIVLKNVPDNSVVVGVPGRVVYKDGQKVRTDVPDIEAEAIKSLNDHLIRLEIEVKRLASNMKDTSGSELSVEERRQSGSNDAENSEDPVDVFLHGAGI